MNPRADLALAAAFVFALQANPTVADSPSERVDRLLASLARYSGPPDQVLATGEVRRSEPPAYYPVAWACGVYFRDAPPPLATLFAELPELRRSQAAYRTAFLNRTADENPAIATWALVAWAAMGPFDAATLDVVRERTTAPDLHVRRAACAILLNEGDDSGAAERSLSQEIRRVGVDFLTHRILSERAELGEVIIAAIDSALDRKLPIDRAAYTLRVISEYPQGFEGAIPLIAELVSTVPPDALRALGALGEPAVPSLARVLSTTSGWNVRRHALAVLPALGEAASSAFDAVAGIATSDGESALLRQQAVRCLARIGTSDLPKLIRELRSFLTDDVLRYAAAVEILRRSNVSKDHLEALDIVESMGWTSAATLAISELGRDGGHLATRLRQAWHKGGFGSVQDRIFLLRALCDIGAKDAETVAILRAALDSESLRGAALGCLRGIGAAAVSTLPEILELCRNDGAPHHAGALAAALAIESANRSAWTILEGDVRANDANRRGGALHVLRRLSATSPRARELVEGCLDDPNVSLRVLACEIVFENRGADDRLIETLTKALGEPTVLVRTVTPLLERIGAKAAPTLPLLRASIYGAGSDSWAARRARDRIARAMRIDEN